MQTSLHPVFAGILSTAFGAQRVIANATGIDELERLDRAAERREAAEAFRQSHPEYTITDRDVSAGLVPPVTSGDCDAMDDMSEVAR